MDEREIRLRCIEAAARNPTAHPDGWAVGARESASVWFDWIISKPQGTASPDTLHLPGKKK